MKRILFLILTVFLYGSSYAQPVFDLGLKAGFHTSNMSVESIIDIDSEAIAKMHWGAFGRIGFGRLYVQPEVYFSQKGGELSSNVITETGDFDYSMVDVPLLLGYKLIKGSAVDFRIMAGPVFSYVVDENHPEELDPFLKEDYFNQHLMGVQYGLGIDFLFLTLDARVEHLGKVYDSSGVSNPEVIPIEGKSNAFVITLGFKIL